MKSIKEKAHEIGWVYSKHYDPIACKQEWCEMAAREGANYVLEQIENVLNNPYQCTFETLKANIEELVIKLKENKL